MTDRRSGERRKRIWRAASAAALAAYALILAYLMFFRRHPMPLRSCNLIPLRTIALMLGLLTREGAHKTLERIALVNLAGNIAAFVPMGFLLPCVWRGLRRCRRTLAVCAAAVIVLEALQYATALGAADVDDLLLNLLGAAVGYAVYAAAGKPL